MISVRSNPSPAAVLPPQEDAWITSYQKLLPHWYSVSLSHQVNSFTLFFSFNLIKVELKKRIPFVDFPCICSINDNCLKRICLTL